ncbi:MAG TPA: hypothetical protein VKQ54_00385 [Caulobacteraceae bacterium]|nr:hypothetical protein [Caulobacteraceae bacterium]
MADIRALTFDVFGTVVDWRSGVAREAQAILAPNGYALDWGAFACWARKIFGGCGERRRHRPLLTDETAYWSPEP